MDLLSIPSPSWNGFNIGPLRIHMYALCILTGIAIAWWLSRKRFVARGGQAEHMESIVTVAVLMGIVGARLYHVATDYQLYFGPGRDPVRALYLWQGGLGIWGAVALGAVGVWWMSRRYGHPTSDMLDVLAPGLLIAQAVGRLGNWFNSELFGRPTSLPWGLEIAPQYRPTGYTQYATFHPTFAYELVWNLLGAAALLWAEKRFHLGRGKLFALYVAIYTFGRFWIERLRIDAVNHVGGWRLNNYTSLIGFVGSVIALAWMLRTRPGRVEMVFAPAPSEDAGTQTGSLDVHIPDPEA
ncbi:MAG TPA: prolipoprotein diacylglyceryl transferase [Propionibacteriaceae bacterium]|nr:prolipoprotein diacylglyceryl transferase [Propionibacteriaceae bacterium]